MRSAVALVIFTFAAAWLFAVWLQQTLNHARSVRAAQWSAASVALQPAGTAMRPAVGRATESSAAGGAALERASRQPLVVPAAVR